MVASIREFGFKVPVLARSDGTVPWFGRAGENSTIWDSPSPNFIMGGSDEAKSDHPTQKPVELMRRPILNHLKRGELVYDPLCGAPHNGSSVALVLMWPSRLLSPVPRYQRAGCAT
ncbi:MAG: DNA methyltransferase [Bryobacteraceae bacterium]